MTILQSNMTLYLGVAAQARALSQPAFCLFLVSGGVSGCKVSHGAQLRLPMARSSSRPTMLIAQQQQQQLQQQQQQQVGIFDPADDSF